MRNVVFLHKWVLYFAVASRKGCVDFSITISRTNTSIKPSHPARDAWILATYFTNVNGKIAVASRKGCVDFSTGKTQIAAGDIVASRKGCVDFSNIYNILNNPEQCRIPQGMRGF